MLRSALLDTHLTELKETTHDYVSRGTCSYPPVDLNTNATCCAQILQLYENYVRAFMSLSAL
jgi:hypothetical protein